MFYTYIFIYIIYFVCVCVCVLILLYWNYCYYCKYICIIINFCSLKNHMRCHLSFHMFLSSPNEKDKENKKLNLLSLSYCDSQRLNYLVQIISQRVPSLSSWNYSLLVKLITFHIKMHGTFAEYHRVHLYIVHIPNML